MGVRKVLITDSQLSMRPDAIECCKYLVHAGYDVAFYSNIGRNERDLYFSQRIAALESVTDVIDWNPDCVFEYARRFAINGLLDIYRVGKYRRNIIVTSPLDYPADSEMYTDKQLVPHSVLSQEDNCWDHLLSNNKWARVHAVYSGCENWLTWNPIPAPEQEPERQFSVSLVVPPYLEAQEQNTQERMALYRGLLKQAASTEKGFVCYSYWDWQAYYPSVPVSGDAIYDILRKSIGTLVWTERWGFNTFQPRLAAMLGCCPYLFDKDLYYRYCYDKDRRVLSFEHPARWLWGKHPPDCCTLPESYRQQTIQQVLQATAPTFSDLHALIDRKGENSSRRYGSYQIL